MNRSSAVIPGLKTRLRSVAAALRERRAALGPDSTQQHIARLARLSVRHLQKLETGEVVPRLDTLLLLAQALGTTAQSILDRAETLRRRL
jgi:transcriptional regulator with XRE-family HTH domain